MAHGSWINLKNGSALLAAAHPPLTDSSAAIWDVVKILSVLDKHFKDIELELIEKVILEEMPHEEHANEFKQIFKTQQLILSTFTENTVVTEYIENFVKSTDGISGDEYNVKLFGSPKSLWHHYWLAKVS